MATITDHPHLPGGIAIDTHAAECAACGHLYLWADEMDTITADRGITALVAELDTISDAHNRECAR